jgi:hypothetical protein
MEVSVPTLPSELELPPQVVVPYPEQYFKLPTLMAAVGPRGKGKTYSLSLWNKWMFDHLYFTRFYCIDPTYESNDSVKVIPLRPNDLYTDIHHTYDALNEIEAKVIQEAGFYKEMTEEYPEKYKEYLSVNRNISKLEPATVRYLRQKSRELKDYYEELEELNETMSVKSKVIQHVLKHREKSPYDDMEMLIGSPYNEMHPWFPAPPELMRPAPLLFLDDLSHTELYSRSRTNPLNNLTLRHRHLGGQGYGMTIQFAVQTFNTGVSKALRENTQQFLLFATRDVNVVDAMYEGIGGDCTLEEFEKMYHHATADPHGFLLVDNNTDDKERIFRKGWDTFLVGFVDHSSRKVNVRKITKKNGEKIPHVNGEGEEHEGEGKKRRRMSEGGIDDDKKKSSTRKRKKGVKK